MTVRKISSLIRVSCHCSYNRSRDANRTLHPMPFTCSSHERRQKKRCWNAQAMKPEQSAAVPQKGQSCAEDMIQLVPPELSGGLESAKDLPPTSPQHGQSSSDDRAAHQVTAESSAAGGSNLRNSTIEQEQASAFCADCAEWKRTT